MSKQKIYTLLFCAIALSGCMNYPVASSYTESPNPERDQLKTMHMLAIAPIINASDEQTLDNALLGNALSEEILRFKRFEVTYPKDFFNSAKAYNCILDGSVEKFVEAGRILKVDGVIVPRVITYNPYYPPSLTLELTVYPTNINRKNANDIFDEHSHGSSVKGKNTRQEKHIWRKTFPIDTADMGTRILVKRFALSHNKGAYPSDEIAFMRRTDRFLEFASHQIAKDLFDASKTLPDWWKWLPKRGEREIPTRLPKKPTPINYE